MELGISGLDHAYEIGAGGSAVVYRARQVDLDREVAVKILSVTDESFVRRFKREAKTLGKLGQGGSIVTVYDTGITEGGRPYLILELCTTSVLEQLNTNGPFEPYAACAAAAQVADALTDAHSHGVVHRDIKPGNILLGQTGRYMVTDFGISTVTGSTFGQTNSVGFTAGYVAPETLTESYAGAPADVYALGATLFHMITGRAPFIDEGQQTNLVALADRVSNEPVPNLRPQGVPDEICRIIESAMAKDPMDRPTAGALRDRLLALDPNNVGADIGAGPLSARTVQATANPNAPMRPSAPPVPETPLFSKTVSGSASARPKSPAEDTKVKVAPAPELAVASVAPAVGRLAKPPVPKPQAREPQGRVASGSGQLPAPPPDRGPRGPGTPGNGNNARGVLGDSPMTTTLPGPQPTSGGILPGLIEELPRKVPLLLISLLGLAGLLAIAAIVIIRPFGDSGVEGAGVEAINAPSTSTEIGGDGSGSSVDDGGAATLDIAPAEQDDDAIGRTTTSSTPPPVTTAASVATTAAPVVKVEVPSVVGSSAAAAEAELTALKFTVTQVETQSATVDVGDVIRQTPAAGVKADQKSAVTIFVATAARVETVALPSLAGKTEAEATAALTDLGLTNITDPTTESSATVAKGLVIKTVPAAATDVALDAPVNLVVSSGPAVPDCSTVIGLTRSEAETKFEAAGLSVDVTEANNPTVADGDVISCNTTATTVDLVVSTGPLGDPCRVVGRQLAAAKSLLVGAGITVTETTVEDDSVPEGEVTDCTINAAGDIAALVSAIPVSVTPPECPAEIVPGQTRESDAVESLNGVPGLANVSVTYAVDEAVRKGRVISCSVSGTTATLQISGVEVPAVGTEKIAARATLSGAGLGIIEVEEANAAEAGTVLGTSPAAGVAVKDGSDVTLRISSGPAATTP